MNYQALFQPIRIGGVEVKNRIIHCAMGGTSPFGIEIAYDILRKGKTPVVVEMLPDILHVPGLCAANSDMLRVANVMSAIYGAYKVAYEI